MAAIARRLVVRDTSTGLYHRARTVDSVPIYFTDIACDVKQHNLRESKVPLDSSKRLLHDCLFWPEVEVA